MKTPSIVLLTAMGLALAGFPGCSCDEDLEQLFPDITVTPDEIDFGKQRVAYEAKAKYNIGNKGNAILRVKSISLVALDSAEEAEFLDLTGTAFSLLEIPEEVGVDEVVEAQVRFLPPSQGKFGGKIVIESDDEDSGLLEIPVFGEGGPPMIEAIPAEVDFGLVNQGPGALRIVQIKNIGYDFLHISDMRILGDETAGGDGGTGTTAFSIASEHIFPLVLDVDETVAVEVRMDPTAEIVAASTSGADLSDAVRVSSDADDDPQLDIPITGEANLGPNAKAVELITRQSEIKVGIGKEVIIDGSETVDPEGDAFTFSWTLVESPDADAILFSGVPGPECATDTECDTANGYRCTDGSTRKCRQTAWTHIVPNWAGIYVVRLRAIDEHGAWGEADALILPRDFALILTWNPQAGSICTQYTEEECDALPAEEQFCPCGQSDLDLHLIRPMTDVEADAGAGAYGLGDYGSCPGSCEETVTSDAGVPQITNHCAEETDEHVNTCRQYGSDCSYANRYPEWGEVGRVDDPRLDVDDVRGYGPEIITLNSPADGLYTAVVHYCNDRLSNEPTDAVLEVYVKGELAFSSDPLLMTEGDAWTAISMQRSGGPEDGIWMFTELSPVVTNLGTGLCNN